MSYSVDLLNGCYTLCTIQKPMRIFKTKFSTIVCVFITKPKDIKSISI